jgi:NADH dehydrogenase FAD-containing subunit
VIVVFLRYSIMEPLREIADVEKYPFTFLEASALDIDPKTNTVSCKSAFRFGCGSFRVQHSGFC